jgi:hypothetical protein
MSDSRGFCPGEGENWVSDLVSRNPKLDIDVLAWHGGRVTTIFNHARHIKESGKRYDVIILQAGHHEYVHPWPKRVMGYKLKKHDPNWESNLTEIDPGQFIYRNDELIRRTLRKLGKCSKHTLLIGLHMANPRWQAQVLTMNDVYSPDDVDYMHIPIHLGWRGKNCYDSIHYSESGREFICGYVERYLNRVGTNVAARISANCGE